MGSHTHPKDHGVAQHANVTREKFIPVHAGRLQAGTDIITGLWAAYQGAANLNEPATLISIKVPDDFVSFTSAKLIWESPAVSGNMYWNMYGSYAASTEAKDTHTDAGGIGTTATGGAGVLNVQEGPTALTLANLARGDYLSFYVYRGGASAPDTLNDVANFIGILFTYVAEQ